MADRLPPFPYYHELRLEASRFAERIDVLTVYNFLSSLKPNSAEQEVTFALIWYHSLLEGDNTQSQLPYQSRTLTDKRGLYFPKGLPQLLNIVIHLHMSKICAGGQRS